MADSTDPSAVPPNPTDADSQETSLQRVTRLEETVAHQQHLLDQLNDVVIGLRRELADLAKQSAEQQSRLKTLMSDHSMIEHDPDERPPHY